MKENFWCISIFVIVFLSLSFAISQPDFWFPVENFGEKDLPDIQVAQEREGVFGNPPRYSLLSDFRAEDHEDHRYWKLGRAVGRLDIKFLDRNSRVEYAGSCTATLISNDWIITNNHCLPGIDPTLEVLEAILLLDYALPGKGKQFIVDIDPVENDSGLDYSILKVQDSPGKEYGYIKPNISSLNLVQEDGLFMIHHPLGGVKRFSRCGLHDGFNSGAVGTFENIGHLCDTQGSSSGALILEKGNNKMLALHFAGYEDGLPVGERFNYAKNISRIFSVSPILPETFLPKEVASSSLFEQVYLSEISTTSNYWKFGFATGRLDVLSEKGSSYCTATLISEDHIITSSHCVPGIDPLRTPKEIQLVMGYQEPDQGEFFSVKTKPFEVNTDLLYTILEVEGGPGVKYGFVPLEVREVLPNERAFMVHHAFGYHSTLSSCLVSGKTLTEPISYLCRTGGGSSGALLIAEEDGAVLGLHFAASSSWLPEAYEVVSSVDSAEVNLGVNPRFLERGNLSEGVARSMNVIVKDSQFLCELAGSHNSQKNSVD